MFCLPRRILSATVVAAAALCAQSNGSNASAEPRIAAIRYWSFGDVTRVAIETHGDYKLTFDHLDAPPRLFFDLHGLRPPTADTRRVQVFHVGDRIVRQIRVAETGPGVSRVVFDLEVPSEFTSSQLVNPDRLMIEVRPKDSVSPESLTSRSRTGAPRPSEIPVMNTSLSETTRPARSEVSRANTLTPPPLPVTSLFQKPAVQFDTEPDETVPKSTLIWNGVEQKSVATTSPPSVKAIARTASPDSKPGDAKQTAAKPRTVNQAPTKSVQTTASAQTAPAGDNPSRIAPARTDESRSLVRVFGLKVHKVVIDAGHGGHDTGTIGPKGLMEKDLVLDVALRLGKLVERRLGAEVVFTRSKDTFIPLEERTRIANNEKADLFISIHANSSPAAVATGVETYYFNFASDQNSIDLATRENASSNSSIFQLNDLLHKAVLNAKVEESREFAQRVQTSLYSMSVRMNNASRDRGVKKAPFVVLIGATMPSILAEIGFVSNPHDEKLLRREDQRQKIAESLYKGLSSYATTLSHTQMAKINSDTD